MGVSELASGAGCGMVVAVNFLNQITSTVISPDKEARVHDWAGIIVHHTGIGNRDKDNTPNSIWHSLHKNTVGWLTKKDANYVSAHFQIGRFGECTMMVDPRTHVAWHAGASKWFHSLLRREVSGLNKYAIGIELLGDGNLGKFSDAQYERLVLLTRALREDFRTIHPTFITGHDRVSPGRKADPGKWFDWDRYYSGIF